MPLVEIENVSKQFASNSVLRELSLEIVEGECLVLVGRSGCGKSTLLNLIAGLFAPDHGTIRIRGIDQKTIPPHRRDLACVFQNGNGYDHLTTRENLRLAVGLQSLGRDAQVQQMDVWVERLELSDLLPRKLCQLSGGQRQKVAIARAFLSGKKLLLVDEPLAHLDQIQRYALREFIAAAQSELGRTIVYVTHDSDEAMMLANRVAVLENGFVQQIGSVRDVHSHPRSAAAGQLLGHPAMQILSLPSEWIRNEKESRLILCGMRPQDWIIHHLFDRKEYSIEFSPATACDCGDYLQVTTKVLNTRWLGERWLISACNPWNDRQPLRMLIHRNQFLDLQGWESVGGQNESVELVAQFHKRLIVTFE